MNSLRTQRQIIQERIQNKHTYKNFFSNRVIDSWNELPQYLIEAVGKTERGGGAGDQQVKSGDCSWVLGIGSFEYCIPVKPSCKKYPNIASIFPCKSCKPCTKNEAFLARYEESCKKNLQDNFLARFWSNLQENYLTVFLARKASFLVQDLQDFMQDLANLARKYLQDLDISCKTVFTGMVRNPCLLIQWKWLAFNLLMFITRFAKLLN